MTSPRLTLVTAPGCHLCERARPALAALADELGLEMGERDLAETGAPDPLWWEQIPLVLVDDEVACFWRVDAAAVRAAVARARG